MTGEACHHLLVVASTVTMTPRRSKNQHWLPATQSLLIALCLGMGCVIYVEAINPSVATAEMAAFAPPLKPQDGEHANQVVTIPPLESFAEVVNRPLFAQMRRPARVEVDATTQPPSGLALVGVVLSNSESHALIEHGQPARMDRAVEGQDVDGWIVKTIRLDRVVLERAGVRADLRIRDLPSSATTQGKANVTKAIVSVAPPAGNPAAEHEVAVQAYMDAHGGMLPAEAQ